MFDSRRDKTLVSDDLMKSVEMEEHYVIMEEPGSKYIDHVSPISGKARDVVTEIQAIVSETESN